MEFAVKTFSIFIYAPKDYRVENIMEMYNDTKTEATNILNISCFFAIMIIEFN